MALTTGMNTTQHIEFLNTYYAARDGGRVFQSVSQRGRWCFHTLGGTVQFAGTTRASAEKKMAKWDADSLHWSKVHNGGTEPAGLPEAEFKARVAAVLATIK